MKQTEIYSCLQEVAEKLNISVNEKNFRIAGVPVKSGFCMIKGENYILIDKHKKVSEKNEILANCLIDFPITEIYIKPSVREYLERFLKKTTVNERLFPDLMEKSP